jgi:hypothetical protein
MFKKCLRFVGAPKIMQTAFRNSLSVIIVDANKRCHKNQYALWKDLYKEEQFIQAQQNCLQGKVSRKKILLWNQNHLHYKS